MSTAAAQPRSNIVKVVAASMAGTTVEWYDFFLYGVAAALVFPKVFFPTDDPTVGTLLALGTFAIGFIARPDRRRWSSATTATGSAARSCW